MHRQYLRRYVRLAPGQPQTFTCSGGCHEAIVAIGDYPGDIEKGSREERMLAPPSTDSRWPRVCEGCTYRFTERDCYQLLTTALRDTDDD